MRGDINLLPKKKAKKTNKLARGFILAVILVSLATGTFLVYLPTKEKVKLQNYIVDKEAVLSTHTATQEEYDALSDELNLIKSRINAFDRINDSNLSKLTLISDIEVAMPTNAILNSLYFSQNTLSISGTTDTNEPIVISQLMVKLRNIEKVSNVRLDSLTFNDPDYYFSLTVTYDLGDLEEIIEEIEYLEEVESLEESEVLDEADGLEEEGAE